MSDGPDFMALFQKYQLIAQYHTPEIISWLRFFKGQPGYQTYLNHYVPLLDLKDREQFLNDVEDPALKAAFSVADAPPEPEVSVVTEVVENLVANAEEVIEETEEIIKKRGRPAKTPEVTSDTPPVL